MFSSNSGMSSTLVKAVDDMVESTVPTLLLCGGSRSGVSNAILLCSCDQLHSGGRVVEGRWLAVVAK